MTVWMVRVNEMYKFESYNTVKLFDSEEKAIKYFEKAILDAHDEYYDIFSGEESLICEAHCDQTYVIYELDNYCENHIGISMTLKEVE